MWRRRASREDSISPARVHTLPRDRAAPGGTDLSRPGGALNSPKPPWWRSGRGGEDLPLGCRRGEMADFQGQMFKVVSGAAGQWWAPHQKIPIVIGGRFAANDDVKLGRRSAGRNDGALLISPPPSPPSWKACLDQGATAAASRVPPLRYRYHPGVGGRSLRFPARAQIGFVVLRGAHHGRKPSAWAAPQARPGGPGRRLWAAGNGAKSDRLGNDDLCVAAATRQRARRPRSGRGSRNTRFRLDDGWCWAARG